jgi:hypothetical protein
MCAKRFPSTRRHLNPSKKRRGVGCEKGNFLMESDATPKIHFLVRKPHVSSDVEAFEGARDVLRTPQDDLRSSDVFGSQSPRAQSPVQLSMFRGGDQPVFSYHSIQPKMSPFPMVQCTGEPKGNPKFSGGFQSP